jgi:hypothetical protein
MTAKGSNPLPARSDSPDIIDGGPEGADIAPAAFPGKPEMPGLRASKAGNKADPFEKPVPLFALMRPGGARTQNRENNPMQSTMGRGSQRRLCSTRLRFEPDGQLLKHHI